LLLVCALGAAAQGPKWVEGELLVKFQGGPRGPSAAAAAERALGHEVRHRFDRIGWQHIRIRPGQTEAEALARLRQRADVIAAEPNYLFELRSAPTVIPNDPRFVDQVALGRIGATNAWALTTGDTNVVVAVLDTGIRYTHEDISANMWRNPGEIPGNGIDDDGNGYIDDVYGIDPVDQDSDPMDQPVGFLYHGTACASIIGAVGNNGHGLAGVNWGVRLMAVRVAAASNFISSAWAAEGFEYVLMMKNGGVNVRVTSNSYGLDDAPSQTLRDALQALGGAGVISVFAAGNATKNVDISCDYPACFHLPSMINVAATDTADVLASFSNYGATNVDLAAPGVNITVADGSSTNGYNASFSGTSASCPYVAGAVALIAAAYPSASVAQIKTALMATVDLLPSLTNKMVSHGRLNIGRAMFYSGLSVGAPAYVVASPQSQTVGVGYSATFTVVATGAQPLDYFWRFGSQVTHTTQPNLSLLSVTLSQAGNYSVIASNALGTSTSAAATLTVVTNPVVLADPIGMRVLDGTNVSFHVDGAGAFPLRYQWRKNGTDLPNETNATINFINTQGAMTGDYRVLLSNSYGAVTSQVARLTVLTRPAILVQPQSQTVAVGANVALSASVTNTATQPIGFRWRQGSNIGPGVPGNPFTSTTNLLNIQTNSSGMWSVLVTNEGVSGVTALLSSNAYLTVVLPPTNQSVMPGTNVTFTALAVGPSPLRYQWQREGTNLPNATNPSLVLANVQPTQAGNYAVIVTNAIGQPTSFPVVLQVVGAPLLTQPQRLADGTFRTIITRLVPNQRYSVEASSNLTQWFAYPAFTATGASMPFVDGGALQTTQKFFRARSGPP